MNTRKSKIFLFCDISAGQGLGHFCRLSFYADHLKRKFPGACFFLVRSGQDFPSIKRLIERSTGIGVLRLENAKERLGLQLKDSKLLVVDSYALTPGELAEWRKNIPGKIVMIDDLKRGFDSADIVISPNVLTGSKNNKKQNRNGQVLLQGEEYFVLSRDYYREHGRLRRIREKPRNILVSLGGNPKSTLLERILSLLKSWSNGKHKIRVLMGPFSESGKKLLKPQKGVRFIRGFADTRSHLLWADIAITSGGVTKYEAAVTGTPSLIVAQHRAQIPFAKPFIEKGGALFLGIADRISDRRFRQQFRIIENIQLRKRLSDKAKNLIDADGFKKIWQFINC